MYQITVLKAIAFTPHIVVVVFLETKQSLKSLPLAEFMILQKWIFEYLIFSLNLHFIRLIYTPITLTIATLLSFLSQAISSYLNFKYANHTKTLSSIPMLLPHFPFLFMFLLLCMTSIFHIFFCVQILCYLNQLN